MTNHEPLDGLALRREVGRVVFLEQVQGGLAPTLRPADKKDRQRHGRAYAGTDQRF
jgi:hypothetical protein